MSKTYIVSRNGGTVTKAPVNDNKIPIYANETALDADLANIPDNTLVATSSGHDDVIDQMKDYIRKQNVLSDWEDIIISTDSNNPTLIDKDGFLMFSWGKGESQGNGQYYIYVNGIGFTYTFTSEGPRAGGTCTIPLKKGDLIYSPYFRWVGICKVAYYKNRDYTGRQI